jgi:7-cyano-7-deazaguanine synthase
MRVVVIYSGGLDSTTLLYHLRAHCPEVRALSINYGQRHLAREMAAAEAICARLGVERRTVDLTSLVGFFGGNALTNREVVLPEGGYTSDTIGVTTVPNRNMVLLSVGIAWAASLGFDAVAFGAHGGEHTNYPDCQLPFAEARPDRACMRLQAHQCVGTIRELGEGGHRSVWGGIGCAVRGNVELLRWRHHTLWEMRNVC